MGIVYDVLENGLPKYVLIEGDELTLMNDLSFEMRDKFPMH